MNRKQTSGDTNTYSLEYCVKLLLLQGQAPSDDEIYHDTNKNILDF